MMLATQFEETEHSALALATYHIVKCHIVCRYPMGRPLSTSCHQALQLAIIRKRAKMGLHLRTPLLQECDAGHENN